MSDTKISEAAIQRWADKHGLSSRSIRQAYEEAAHLHPQPAELVEQQIQPVNADEAPFGLTTAEKVAWARGANDAIKEYGLAATGKQQVGEASYHPAQRQADIEGRIEPSARELEGLHDQQVGEVQGDEHARVLRALRAILNESGRSSPARTAALDAAIAALAARQPGAQEPVAFAVESPAFETHAKLAGLNMEQHPLHYLFLDPKTYAARQAWKAALKFAPPAQGIDLSKLQRYRMASSYENHRNLYQDDTGSWVKIQDVERLIDQRDAAPGV